jgi:hypothetical protein
MSLPCPVCRAANDAGPTCRRCRADLSLCFAVENRRDHALAAARAAVAQGRFAEASHMMEVAAALRSGDDVTRLRAAVALLAGDYPASWGLYRTPGAAP